jgi:hypothetical protein
MTTVHTQDPIRLLPTGQLTRVRVVALHTFLSYASNLALLLKDEGTTWERVVVAKKGKRA